MILTSRTSMALTAVLRFLNDPRWFFASLLFLFSVIGRLYLGFWSDWSQALTAIAATVALELILGKITVGRWVHPASALMTGISLSILLTTPPGTYWPYLLGAAIAIGSKYAIRYRGAHVFNPSNVAVAVLVLFLPQYGISNPSQWTNHIGPTLGILALGLVVATRAKRIPAVSGFVGGFMAMAALRSWAQGLPLLWAAGPALGAEFQLFTFFMLTDPKTSPKTRRGQIIYGLTVALLDAALRMARITYSPFYALILTCLVVPFLNHHFHWTRAPGVKGAAAHGNA